MRAVAPDVRAEWRSFGLHGDVSLAEVMNEGFRVGARTTKVYRSRERPRTADLGEIDAAGRRLAAAFHDLGLRPGDVIAIQLPNWFENDVVIRAAVLLGLVFLPITPIYGPAELGFILRQSGARALVVPDRFRNIDFRERLDRLTGVPDLVHVIAVGADVPSGAVAFEELMSRFDGAAPPPEPKVGADEVCALVYTSGTTAEPKGVQHTHNTLLAERGGLSAVKIGTAGIGGDKPALQLFPAGHIAAALGTIFLFAASKTVVAFDAFDADDAVAAIEEFRLAGTAGAPVFLARILDVIERGERDLSSLESFVVGASSVPAALVERADALGVKAVRCYGSSEHPTVTISAPTDPLWTRAYTDGRCLPGNRVRIVDDDGNDVRDGAVGEIATLGPDLFVGYRDPVLDADAFLPGGWYRTGDLGRLDGDGYLAVTDRKKDIIIRGGENISAKEVEDVLVGHPAVQDVAVVAEPDPQLGERVCAFVVVRHGWTIDADAVRRHFGAAGVARQKTPERLVVVDDLPRTQSGKVQKHLLRERLRG